MVARESLILGVSRFSVRLEVKLSPVNGYVDVLSTSCRRPVDVLSTSCRRLQEKDDERRPRSFLLIRESRFVACRGELSKEAFECIDGGDISRSRFSLWRPSMWSRRS